jgi:hypothetical protein
MKHSIINYNTNTNTYDNDIVSDNKYTQIEYTNPKNSIVPYNSTNNDEVDNFGTNILYLLIDFLILLCFIDIFKKIYVNYIRYRGDLLIIRTNNTENYPTNGCENYPYNRVIIKDSLDVQINDKCSICLDALYTTSNDNIDIETNNDIIQLRCNHMFHKNCLDPWVLLHKTCPLCKREVT